MPATRRPEVADVLIIGAGASGATAAKVLTEAGVNVVALERGPWRRPEEFSGDEIKYINRTYLWEDQELKPRTKRESADEVAVVTRFSPTPQTVGGGTTHWNAQFPRPTVDDLRLRSIHGAVDGTSLADWPVTYDELEPFYTRIEWEFGASGQGGLNRYEGPRSRDYPCPPAPVTGYGKAFYKGCAELGLNAFPFPMAMVTTPHKGRTPMVHSGFWQEYGDPATSKSTTLTSFVPEALATGRYELRPDCYVLEVTVGRDGRATGAIYLDKDGREIEQRAKTVLLCCGGIETARLLLMSSSSQFPDGLANSSGQVGRNAMFHEYVFAIGLFDREVHPPLRGWSGSYTGAATYEFYKTDLDRGHIGGGIAAGSTIGHPVNWNFPGRPAWGPAAKDADREFFNHTMKIGVPIQDVPQESNTVDLDPDVKDAWGMPVARITAKPHANDIAQARWTVDRCAEVLQAAGASKVMPVYLESFTGNCSHEMGTARMGDDPSRSVVDRWCRSHDVSNLYVLDGSVFPTSLGANPTLTIMANAWRCAGQIVRERRAGATAADRVGART
jgi:choline dehydrogenase-like flavoprotein